MGAAASLQFQNLPEKVDREAAEKLARSGLIDMTVDDWPVEKWEELTKGGDGTCGREAFIAFCVDLSTVNGQDTVNDCKVPSSTANEGNLSAVDAAAEEEEIFATDGELEHSMDDELALGTFNDDEYDGGADEGGRDEDLGGMIIPDLAVVAIGGGSAAGVSVSAAGNDAVENPGEEEIIVADGEAFESSKGPGCFDEEGLSIAGSKISSEFQSSTKAGLMVKGSSPVRSM